MIDEAQRCPALFSYLQGWVDDRRTPKLYFLDPGLAAWLVGIRDAPTLAAHALRSALFETWAVSEHVKACSNAGVSPALHFWRDHAGHEVDLVVEAQPGRVDAVELKSGATYAGDWARSLQQWRALAAGEAGALRVVYGGDTSYAREGVDVLSWRDWPLRP